uniref:Uncharacterized protein n=1 Tax=Panagrolaimus davidi TaxID=227884 RepID=A0A914PHB6_9BILA
MNKDSIPLYSGYDNEEEKPSNLYKIITNILKVITFILAILVIGFAAACATFATTYYFTAKNEQPSDLMDESCFIQIPFQIVKNLQVSFF